MNMSTPPVANFPTSATVACPSGLADPRCPAAPLSERRNRGGGHARGAARRGHRALAHFVLAQAGKPFRDRHVGREVIIVESGRILRRLVQRDNAGHHGPPLFVSVWRNSVAHCSVLAHPRCRREWIAGL